MTISVASEPTPLKIDSDGVVRVGHTRVTLDTVVYAFLDGATAEEITQQYPSLELADVYMVIGYYLRRRPEVDDYLRKREQQAQKVRKENEKLFTPLGIRERLMARASRHQE